MLRLANEEGRRQELSRFGYSSVTGAGAVAAYDKEWGILKQDFRTIQRPKVPEFDDLASQARELATRYVDQRRALDQLMNKCDATHLEILRTGPEPDLVERYALARDAFEDAVEAFGVLREQIEAALRPR